MELENFVSLDVEIANAKRASVCQIALVKVESGAVSASWSSYVKPAPEFQELGFFQHRVHKIEKDTYLEAPTLEQLWPTIFEFIGDDVLVAHNAAFDMSALKQSLDSWNVLYELPDAICTMKMAQESTPELRPTLKNLCLQLNIELTDHHNAEVDARACAELALRLIPLVPSQSLAELVDAYGYQNHVTSKNWGSNPALDKAREEFVEMQWEIQKFFQQNPNTLRILSTPLADYRIGLIRSLYSLSDEQTGQWIEALGGVVDFQDQKFENVDFVLVGNHPCRDASRKLLDVKRLATLKRTNKSTLSSQEFYNLVLDALVE